MTDFFSALELELHGAAERRPRRPIGVGQALGAAAALVLLASAVMVALAVVGGGGEDGDGGQLAGARQPDPVGTVIPRGEGRPKMGRQRIVVANGVAPVNGPWQIEVYRTDGERDTSGQVMWRRGWCMWIRLLDPPDRIITGSGFCGAPKSLGFRKTPGFSRSQTVGRSKPMAKEILVWGRVPDRAALVVIAAPGGKRIELEPADGPDNFPGRFYAIPVKPPLQGARINWLDAEGKRGSRGIGLMPPISR
jgi:hypothetical protein